MVRYFISFAVFALILAGNAPRLISAMNTASEARTTDARTANARSADAMAVRPDVSPRPATNSRSLTVRPDDRGHFHVEGRIDGRRMAFLVDTGATIIAIPEREAARLGIHPSRSEYTAQMRTANGTIRAAPVRLNMVEVGDIIVRDVAAVVMPDEALSQNLLGMSFLSRLRRFEVADRRLVMEQ